MAEICFREIEEILEEALDKDKDHIPEDMVEDEEAHNKALCEGQEPLTEEKIAACIGVPEHLTVEADEIIFSLIGSVSEEMDLAFSYLDEVLYARIFDGEKYIFPLPFLLTDDADAVGACINLAEYSVKYMIPLIISDVPRDELDFLLSIFPHVDGFIYDDEDDDSFFLKVNNECDMLDCVPRYELDEIILDELRDSDKERYAELCRDRELNKYWGYDADVDNPDGDADFYLETARYEFDEGIAIALAVREGGELVGEATIYGFDYRGSASIAVRVMRDCHGRGIGTRATRALIELAKEIGLSTVKAEILTENTASVKMTAKCMTLEKEENGKVYFTLEL